MKQFAPQMCEKFQYGAIENRSDVAYRNVTC